MRSIISGKCNATLYNVIGHAYMYFLDSGDIRELIIITGSYMSLLYDLIWAIVHVTQIIFLLLLQIEQ